MFGNVKNGLMKIVWLLRTLFGALGTNDESERAREKT